MNSAVRLTSTMLRAISLGVFCRRAPSIIADHPVQERIAGFGGDAHDDAVAETLVPPVTALRSPPLSRTTGADSPVMADSSTVAMPSTISPSAGMKSPASQTKQVANFQLTAGDWRLPCR